MQVEQVRTTKESDGKPRILSNTMLSLPPTDPRLAWPLFTVAEAAEYLDMPASTLFSWVGTEVAGRQLVTTLPHEGHMPRIPFIGFAEAFVLQAAKKAGVPSQRIKPNVAAILEEFPSIPHALASRRIYTDGAELLVMRDEDQSGITEVPRLRQRQLTETVRNQLQLITYGEDGFARRLILPRYHDVEVTVDPLVASGRPLLHGARVKDVVDRYKSGDREEEIAEAFGVRLEQVQALVGRS
jgi:uncharacterized protein (DUF433 family)